MKKRNGKSFISKKERKKLYHLVQDVDWGDEDSVFNLGVELGKYSVFLRSKILEINDDEFF